MRERWGRTRPDCHHPGHLITDRRRVVEQHLQVLFILFQIDGKVISLLVTQWTYWYEQAFPITCVQCKKKYRSFYEYPIFFRTKFPKFQFNSFKKRCPLSLATKTQTRPFPIFSIQSSASTSVPLVPSFTIIEQPDQPSRIQLLFPLLPPMTESRRTRSTVTWD